MRIAVCGFKAIAKVILEMKVLHASGCGTRNFRRGRRLFPLAFFYHVGPVGCVGVDAQLCYMSSTSLTGRGCIEVVCGDECFAATTSM